MELDIVKFIRQQKMLKVMLSLLFSKQERYLISKNRRLTVSDKKQKEMSDSTDDQDPTKILINTERLNELLQQTFDKDMAPFEAPTEVPRGMQRSKMKRSMSERFKKPR